MLHLSPTPVTLWIGIVALLVVAVLCVLSWKRSPHRGRTALLEILRFLAAAAVVLLFGWCFGVLNPRVAAPARSDADRCHS